MKKISSWFHQDKQAEDEGGKVKEHKDQARKVFHHGLLYRVAPVSLASQSISGAFKIGGQFGMHPVGEKFP